MAQYLRYVAAGVLSMLKARIVDPVWQYFNDVKAQGSRKRRRLQDRLDYHYNEPPLVSARKRVELDITSGEVSQKPAHRAQRASSQKRRIPQAARTRHTKSLMHPKANTDLPKHIEVVVRLPGGEPIIRLQPGSNIFQVRQWMEEAGAIMGSHHEGTTEKTLEENGDSRQSTEAAPDIPIVSPIEITPQSLEAATTTESHDLATKAEADMVQSGHSDIGEEMDGIESRHSICEEPPPEIHGDLPLSALPDVGVSIDQSLMQEHQEVQEQTETSTQAQCWSLAYTPSHTSYYP